MSPADWITLVAVVIALGALVIEGSRVRRGQRHALATQYIQRYWEIDDQLLLVPKDKPRHRHHRHRYLRLCEDEFAAVRTGMLDTAMWSEWHSWLASPAQRQQLITDLETVGARAEFEYLRACLSGNEGHAWTQCRAVPLTRRYRAVVVMQDLARSIFLRVKEGPAAIT